MEENKVIIGGSEGNEKKLNLEEIKQLAGQFDFTKYANRRKQIVKDGHYERAEGSAQFKKKKKKDKMVKHSKKKNR